VLRCSGCGGRLVVHTRRYEAGRNPESRSFHAYRCPGKRLDCPQPVAIAAPLAELEVERATRLLLAERQGSASIGDELDAARVRLERAELERDGFALTFAGIGGDAARERALALQSAVDAAADALDELQTAAGPALTLSLADWDTFELDERRRLIRLALDAVFVEPAGELVGADRLRFVPRGAGETSG